MESDGLKIGDFAIRYYSVNTLIIGSGTASLNAAISLRKNGVNDLLIATSKWGAGTSNNAGSDKQTYYKLSLCGDEPDSVHGMARDLFSSRCMHGDIALCEAQGSVQAFMRLVELGVPFPYDSYGSWAGYKTDNDPRARATSAGPRTSQMMFRALSAEVRRLKVRVMDNHQVISLLTDIKGQKVIGAIAINTKERDPLQAFVLINATNIILGTGGPGDIYAESVYPLSQKNSTGMAFRAGATGQNLTESQFGIASLKFRWNLSGSYQQVVPMYFSTDSKGKEEREFLNEIFPDYRTLTLAIFRKGYQWPFDPEKISQFGSSLIDILIYREIHERGRRVFLDFRRNISIMGHSTFNEKELDAEVFSYLKQCAALADTPSERLKVMNLQAFKLFLDHGIDLSSEPVEIGICAQHNNGGLKADIWWESDLRHLFPVGEVNGSHGVNRPGGAALNSGQVGSYRAAQFISQNYNQLAAEKERFLEMIKPETASTLDLARHFLSAGQTDGNNKILKEIRDNMSDGASIIRGPAKIDQSVKRAGELYKKIKDLPCAKSAKELATCFRLLDNSLLQLIYLDAIRKYIELGGRSRGSFLIIREGDASLSDILEKEKETDLCKYDRDIEREILETKFSNGKIVHNLVKVRDIPEQYLWFEKVWKDYLGDNFSGS
jgi:succinate dehydrogenase/fumarate reductase flavoprotein subunit